MLLVRIWGQEPGTELQGGKNSERGARDGKKYDYDFTIIRDNADGVN
jgi:hypothetical protein